MYIEWRGLGLLAGVPPVFGVVAVGALIDYGSRAAELGFCLTVAASGAALVFAGRKLNQYGNHHAVERIPLWVFGAAYVAIGLGLAGWVGFLVIADGWQAWR